MAAQVVMASPLAEPGIPGAVAVGASKRHSAQRDLAHDPLDLMHRQMLPAVVTEPGVPPTLVGHGFVCPRGRATGVAHRLCTGRHLGLVHHYVPFLLLPTDRDRRRDAIRLRLAPPPAAPIM